MESLQMFSEHYANGVTAVLAIFTFLAAVRSLLYVKKEYERKYRPYVIPDFFVGKQKEGIGFAFSISPKNVGPHPCYFKIVDINLMIGDENYPTPSMQNFLLLGPGVNNAHYPIGHINEQGVMKIRNHKYTVNRVVMSFSLVVKSVDEKFEELQKVVFEVNVEGEDPIILTRPEWETRIHN